MDRSPAPEESQNVQVQTESVAAFIHEPWSEHWLWSRARPDSENMERTQTDRSLPPGDDTPAD